MSEDVKRTEALSDQELDQVAGGAGVAHNELLTKVEDHTRDRELHFPTTATKSKADLKESIILSEPRR